MKKFTRILKPIKKNKKLGPYSLTQKIPLLETQPTDILALYKILQQLCNSKSCICPLIREWLNKLWYTHKWNPLLKRTWQGFPSGAVVKNPPANAGDMGLSPCPTCHGATKPVLSLHYTEPALQSPRATTTESTCHNY